MNEQQPFSLTRRFWAACAQARRRATAPLTAGLCAFLLATPAWGQITASISGGGAVPEAMIVRDGTGAVIPAMSQETSLIFTVTLSGPAPAGGVQIPIRLAPHNPMGPHDAEGRYNGDRYYMAPTSDYNHSAFVSAYGSANLGGPLQSEVTGASVSIAEGMTTGMITIRVNDKSTSDSSIGSETGHESDESIAVTLMDAPAGVTIDAANATAIGTILDNDPPPVIEIGLVGSASRAEDSGNIEFTVKVNSTSSHELIIAYAPAGGTANTADFTGATGRITVARFPYEGFLWNPDGGGPGTEVYNPDEREASYPVISSFRFTIPVTIIDDETFEPDEELVMGISPVNPLLATPSATAGTATVTITSDSTDTPPTTPTIEFVADPAPVTEGNWTVGGNLGEDEPQPPEGTRVPAGTGVNANWTIIPFTVRLTGTISDDVTVRYSMRQISDMNYLALAGSHSSGPNDGERKDFHNESGRLTFMPSSDSFSEQTITAWVWKDNSYEVQERFEVVLSNVGAGAQLGGKAVAIGRINDDDAIPELSLRSTALTVDETAANVVFTLEITATSTRDLLVAYETVDGTATAGEDFMQTSGTLTLGPDMRDSFDPSTTIRVIPEITVPLMGDEAHEGNEQFTFRLSPITNNISYSISDPPRTDVLANASVNAAESTATVTIRDDDDPPTEPEPDPEPPAGPATTVVTVRDATATEGGGTIGFEVTLMPSSAAPLTVQYTTTDVTTTASDYTASGSQVIAANAASGMIEIDITDDSDIEPTETFTLTLTGVTGGDAELGGTTTATGTINNNDPGLLYSLPDGSPLPSPIAVAEDDTTTYRVALATDPGGDVVVNIDAGGITGVTAAPTSLTFDASDWSTPQNVVLSAAADDGNSDAETGNLVHSYPASNAAGYTDSSAAYLTRAVTTIDDEADPAALELTIDPTSLTEGETQNIVVTVAYDANKTIDAAAEVVVTVAGDGRTATADDFTATTNPITITIPDGDNSATGTLTITAANDDIDEGRIDGIHEHHLEVTGVVTAKGATLTDTATLAISDNDVAGLEYSGTANLTVLEDGTQTYQIALGTQPTGDVILSITVEDSDGNASDKATVTPPTLTFSPSGAMRWEDQQTITIAGTRDADDEDVDGLKLVHAFSSPNDDVYNNLPDDEVGLDVTDVTAILTIADSTVDEEADEILFTVTSTHAPQPGTTVIVQFSTADGTATAGTALGDDYTAVAVGAANSTVTIAPGETETIITVDLPDVNDDFDEGEGSNDYEQFTVTLANAECEPEPTEVCNAVLGGTITATGTINDDDEVALVLREMDGATDLLDEGASATGHTVVEQGTFTYQAMLATRPTHDVTVTITPRLRAPETDESDKVSLSTYRLVFEPAEWNVPQTVVVTGTRDAGMADETLRLDHAISSTDGFGATPNPEDVKYNSLVDNVDVNFTVDDLTVILTIESSPAALDEDHATVSTIEFTVTASQAPRADTTITVQYSTVDGTATSGPAADGGDYEAIDAATLIIPAGGTIGEPTTGTFTVTVLDNEVDEDQEQFTVTLLDNPGCARVLPATTLCNAELGASITATGTITDAADTAALVLTETDGTTRLGPQQIVLEDRTIAYQVQLASDPTENIVVDITVRDATGVSVKATVNPTSLTFTPTGGATPWNTAQAVTVFGTRDADDTDEALTIRHDSRSADADSDDPKYDASSIDVNVGLTVDDVTAILTIVDSTVDESDGTIEFVVTASQLPRENTTITVAYATSDLIAEDPRRSATASPADTAGTATAGTDYVAKTGTLTFASDDSDRTETITITGILDDDLDEETEEAFTVTLNAQSCDPITPPTLVCNTSLGTLSGGTAVHVAAGVETITATGTITDNETRGITLDPPTLTINEQEADRTTLGTATYTVVLDTQPTADVTLALDGFGDNEVITLDQTSLTFAMDGEAANAWNTAQTVAVTAVSDLSGDDETPTITHTATGGDYGDDDHESQTADEVVTVVDDETAALVLFDADGEELGKFAADHVGRDKPTLIVYESETITYAVLPNSRPIDNVVVDITAVVVNAEVSATAEAPTQARAWVSPTSLTFSPDDWTTPKTVTVSGIEDRDNAVDRMLDLTHDLSSPDTVTNPGDPDHHNIPDVVVRVDVYDNDAQRVLISDSELALGENMAIEYAVAITTQPAGVVVVTTDVTGSADAVTVSPPTLTFDAVNWSLPQAITISSDADDGNRSDEAFTITHSVAGTNEDDNYDEETPIVYHNGADNPTEAAEVLVTIHDAPVLHTARLIGAPRNGSIYHAGETITVALDFDDGMNQPEKFVGADTSAPTAMPPTLALVIGDNVRRATFKPHEAGEPEHQLRFTYEVAAGERDADGIALAQVGDTEDGAALTAAALLNLNGSTLTYTDSDSDYASDYALGAVSVADLELEDIGDPAYEVGIMVAIEERVEVQESAAEIVFTVALTGSIDEDFTAVVNTANGTAVVPVAADPSGTPPAVDGDYTAIANGTLTITAGATEGTITVALLDAADIIDEGDEETFTVTISEPSSNVIPGSPLAATGVIVEDDDASGGITLSARNEADNADITDITEPTGTDATETVVLVKATVSNGAAYAAETIVTVAVAGTQPAAADAVDFEQVTAFELTIDAGSNSGQASFTLTLPAEDPPVDEVNEVVQISGTALPVVAVTPGTIELKDGDGDASSLTLTVTPASVVERADEHVIAVTASYDAESNDDAVTEVVVTVAPDGATATTADYETDPVTITVPMAANSATAMLTIDAVDDDLDEDDQHLVVTGTVTIGTVTLTDTTGLTITDNDTAGLAFTSVAEAPAMPATLGSITVPEDATRMYRVELTSEPTETVTVAIAPNDAEGGSDKVTVSPASLEFAAADWATALTVTVTGTSDTDDRDEDTADLVLTHAVSSDDAKYGALADATTLGFEVTDITPILTIASPDAVAEGDGQIVFMVTASHPAPEGGTAVDYSTQNGTARASTDYIGAVSDASFTIAAGEMTAAITIDLLDNDVDAEAEADALTFTLTLDGTVEPAVLGEATVAVGTINDDDTRGITLVGTATATEKVPGAYTVVLDTQPTAEVTVELTVEDAEVATVTPTALTFAPAAWNQPQTVTVAGVADDTADDEATTVTHTATGGDYTRPESDPAITATQTITVTDDDVVGLAITDADGRPLGVPGPRLVVRETASVAYQVALTSEPTDAVTVAIAPSDTAKAAVSPASLTFTAEDWDTPQPVTLTGSADADSDDVTTLSLVHTPSSTGDSDYDGLGMVFAGATVLDSTTPEVIVSHNAIVVPENDAAEYRVRVTALPTGGDVSVTPALASGAPEGAPFGARFTRFDPGLGKFVPAHLGAPLVFTADNWTAWQTVRIHAPVDDDATAERFNVSHAVSTPVDTANYHGIAPAYEDGAGGAVGTARSLQVTLQEPGGAPVFDRAYLSAAPADDAGNYMIGERIEVVLSFTGLGHREAVYVDDTAPGAEPPTLQLQIGDVVRQARLPANRIDSGGAVIDNDGYGQLRFSYEVVVGDRDANAITLAPNALQLNGSRLTYGEGRVPLGALSLAAYEEGQDPQRSLHQESYGVGPDYALVSIDEESVQVQVDEDADQILFTVTSSAARDEAITIPYATGAPDAAATADDATAAATAGADYMAVADGTLTIAAGETTAVVTIDLLGDVIDEGDEAFAVRLSDPSPPLLAQLDGVTTAHGVIADDDAAPTGIALTARNAGDTADLTFVQEGTDSTVVLVKAAPSGGTRFNEAKTVRVSVAGISEHADPVEYCGPEGSCEPEGHDGPAAEFTITIPAGAASGSMSFTLRLPVDDNIRETNETLRISGVAVTPAMGGDMEEAGGESGEADEVEDESIAVQAAHIVLTDNDGDHGLPQRIMLTVAPGTLGEDAGATDVVVTASFDAATNNIPTAVGVVVTVAGDGATTTAEDFTGGETITIEIPGLADSGTGTIKLTPVDDDIDEPVQNLAITATAVLDEDNTLTASATLAITDNDAAGVVATDAEGEAFEDAAAALTVAEDGTVSYMVALASQPTAPVTLDIAAGDGAKAAAAPSSLTFEPDDWHLAREVVVSGVDDADNGDEAIAITHAASSAGDAVYDELAAVELGLAVKDDDQPGVITTPSEVTMNEDGTSIYSVQLATQPMAAVTLTVGVADGDETAIALSPETLTFDAANWSAGQPVTLTALNDADIEDETVTIVHSAASENDAAYDAMADVELSVTIADEDEIDIAVSTARIELGEERAATYTVSLDAAPTGELTLTAAFAGDTPPDDASVQPAALTFTAENWDVPGTLTVSALADADGLDETHTLTHTPTGGGYGDAELPPITVEITDNDAPRLLAVGIAEDTKPMSGDTYGIGETIMLEVAFSRPVAVEGTPQLKLVVGENDRLADYVPPAAADDDDDEADDEDEDAPAEAEALASAEPIAQEAGMDADAGKLTFAYTIQAGDEAPEGIGIPEDDPLELGEGDAIVDAENDGVQAFVVPDMEVFKVDIPADATKVDGDQDFMLTAEAGGKDGIIETHEGTTAIAADGVTVTHTPTVVTLSGSGKAGEMDRIGYAWSLKGGADAGPDWLTLEGADKAMATFEVPNIRSSMNLTFVLTVSNTRTENEATDEVEVQITAANAAPEVVVAGGASRTAEEGTEVTLNASGSTDPEGETLTFSWLLAGGNPQHVRASTGMNTHTGIVSLGVNIPNGSVLTFALTVTDEGGATGASAVTVTITSTPLGLVLEHALTRFGRALGTSAVDTLADRFNNTSARSGSGGLTMNVGGTQMNLARMMPQGFGLAAPGVGHDPNGTGTGMAANGTHATGGGTGMATNGMHQATSPAGVFMASHFEERMVASRPLPIRLPTLDRNALMRSTFEINLGPGEDELGASAGGGGVGVGWSLWGRFDNRIFEAEPEGEGLTLEGSAMIGYLGADARLGGDQDVLLGVAVSSAESEVDYKLGDLPGELAIRMVSIHPYANWELSDRLSVWGTLGAGGGDAQIISDKGHDLETDIDMSMVAVGGRNEFASPGDFKLALKGDLLVVTTKADGIESRAVQDIDTNVQRLRVGAEAKNTLPVGPTASFEPSIELSARVDAGDAETGFGLEIGIGGVFANTDLGLSAEVRVRQLVTHAEDGIAETGISAAILYDPGGPSTGGLSARLTPTWGDMQSTAQAMWQGDAPMFGNMMGAQGRTDDGSLPYNMNAELQYDILLSKWSLSPYGSMNVSGAADRKQVGLRVNALQMENGNLSLDLFGEQATGTRRAQQADATAIKAGIQATLNLRF